MSLKMIIYRPPTHPHFCQNRWAGGGTSLNTLPNHPLRCNASGAALNNLSRMFSYDDCSRLECPFAPRSMRAPAAPMKTSAFRFSCTLANRSAACVSAASGKTSSILSVLPQFRRFEYLFAKAFRFQPAQSRFV